MSQISSSVVESVFAVAPVVVGFYSAKLSITKINITDILEIFLCRLKLNKNKFS